MGSSKSRHKTKSLKRGQQLNVGPASDKKWIEFCEGYTFKKGTLNFNMLVPCVSKNISFSGGYMGNSFET